MEMMTASAVAQMIGGTVISGDHTIEADNGAIDSRNVTNNSIFFAIPGTKCDGHDFINNAVNAGAKIIVVEKKLEELILDENAKKATYIKVISSMRALASMASAYRNKFDIPVVGITGSVGKTTTKEMVYSVLSAKYKTLKSEGNYNSETGLPLSILNLNRDYKTAVFEMGMDQMGEIDFLTRIARPYIGIITNIGVSHIEILGSQKNILRAKLEIENGLMDDGTMILNADDDYLYSVKNNLKHPIIYYGIENADAEYRAENIKVGDKTTEFDVITPYGRFSAKINAMGKHNVFNALAAIITGFLSFM